MNRARHLIKFDETLHPTGERIGVGSHAMRQALAWWVGAELLRRHPDELRLIETNPHGYDALTIVQRGDRDFGEAQTLVYLNKCGGICHITPRSWFGSDSERFNWLEVLLSPNRREYVVKQIELAEGLPSPTTTPPTQASSVGPSVIAAYLSRTMLAPTRWLMRNGADFDDEGPSINEELFAVFPDVDKDRHRHDAATHPQHTIETRYWSVCRVEARNGNYPPVMVIDIVTGTAWTQSGTVNLLDRYRALGSKIDALASDVLPPTH